MGWEYHKRPLLARGLHAASGLSPSTTPEGVDGDVNISDDLTVLGSLAMKTEAITTTNTPQTLSADGISFVTYGTSGITNDLILPAPPKAGAIKHILVINNTTSVELNINTATTDAGDVFWGTTWNTATISAASTGSPGGTPAGTVALMLIAHSTSQWAIVPGSSFNWDFTATTGSSGQV